MKQYSHDRRKILKLIMLGSGTAFAPAFIAGCGKENEGSTSDSGSHTAVFPQSVASGDPRPTSVIVWTRLGIDDTREENVPVTLDVSPYEDFRESVHSRKVYAYRVFDYAIKVKLEQLLPDTYYYYRFTYKGHHSATGRTKTAPDTTSEKKISFAYISCQDYIGRFYNIYEKLIDQDDLDFVVHLGDYIYETN